jgi:hypothetical protein
MPQVPIYNGPQVREQALQGGFQQNIDVSSSTRALGQGLLQVAEVADRVVMREAETKANATDTEIAAGWLQWDAENRKKYQGSNAGQYGAAAEKWWADAANTYGKDFDPLAKSMVGKTLGRRKAASLGQVSQFVETEKEKHADETAAANVNTTIQFGVSSGDVVGAAARVRELAAQVGARKGWTTEQVQAEQAKSLSALHLTQISKLAEQDPAKAQAYYDANKTEVGFAQQPRVEEVLRKEADNQFATQFAAQQAGKPLSEQIKATAEIKDPARREKALVEVKNNYALVQQAQLEREKQLSDQAWQLVGQGKKVPESVLAAMDGKERVQLQEHLRLKAARAAEAGGPKPIKTDTATHARLIDMMLNDPEAFKTERLAAHAMKLSQTDLEQFAAKQQALRGNNTGKQDSMMTDAARVDGAITAAGIDAKKNPDVAYKVQMEIDRRVRADSVAKGGKDLTADEKQKHIDAVLMDKVFVTGWGRDSQKPLALLKPEELKDAYVTVNGADVKLSTIPLTDRQQIIDALRRRGEVASEQSIAEIYLRNKKPAAPAAPAAPAMAPGTVLQPAGSRTGMGKPSIYAPPEEWAAYRAWQAQQRLAAGK